MTVATKVVHAFDVSLKWEKESDSGIIRAGNRMPLLISAPPEFDGSDNVWSAEHLLIASLSSCYATTLVHFAKLLRVNIHNLHMHSAVEIEKEHPGGFSAKRFVLRPVIEFRGDPSQHTIDNLLSKAKRYCIISNSVSGEIMVEPEIILS